ncbi:MAG: ATP-NAD kinase family protein [Candidatus Thermoplasmatota archaeon]|nr:ATP-NAD kinase family protein [Candidatus Thermoplasmatota archaeon]
MSYRTVLPVDPSLMDLYGMAVYPSMGLRWALPFTVVMKKLCLVINPIAGMGGKVGLKGTDGVVEEAVLRGALPGASDRAQEALSRLKEAFTRHRLKEKVIWFTAGGPMGEEVLRSMEVEGWEVRTLLHPSEKTTSSDTVELVRLAVSEGVDLIVFCGGDGTARDVFGTAGSIPILGIPSGVKMHSGVFALDPYTAGELLEFYIRGEMTTGEGEIMDLDEDRYRKGEWNIRLFGTANTLYEPTFIQTGKFMVAEQDVSTILDEIADDIAERIEGEPGSLFILGPGGTLSAIGERLGIDKTHLGVDIVRGKMLIGKDLGESDIISMIDSEGNGRRIYLVVSPIGGQGFFLGRGNLQIGPEVIKRVGIKNIIIVSALQKLDRTPHLSVDTGDHSLDLELKKEGSYKVLTGYRTYRMKQIK